MRCIREEIERLDTSLVSLAQEETALRLRLGQVLEGLSGGGFFELGFSSLAAYVLERCDRSVRWAEAARCLARRVEALPELRRAMAMGKVSWSMGEVLARVAQPEDEARWIEAAKSRTVREMRGLVVAAVAARRGADVADVADPRAAVSMAPAAGVPALAEAAAPRAMETVPALARAAAPRAMETVSTAPAGAPALVGAAPARAIAPVTAGAPVSTLPAGAPVVAGAPLAAGAGALPAAAVATVLAMATRPAVSDNDYDGGGAANAVGDGSNGDGDEMCMLIGTVDREQAWLLETTQPLLEQPGVHGPDAQSEALGVTSNDNADSGDADADEMCTLTCTVDQEEAWLFEATRSLLEQLGVHGADAQSEALLAEGQETLLAMLPKGTVDIEQWEGRDTTQRRWVQQLGRWRDEAEALCEKHIWRSLLSGREQSRGERGNAEPVHGSVAVAAALGTAALEHATGDVLDGHVRELSRALARHELELSRLVLEFHRADGWRRLGYATETQYARERLGLSRSSLLARRSLALRLAKLPLVAAALGTADIGVEAALQVVRVATASTQAAWVERARQRTIKHSREEVSAALTAVRVSGEVDCPPPADDELAAFHELEQAVVSGRACRDEPATSAHVACGASTPGADASRLVEPASDGRRAWFVMLGSLARWLCGGLQLSAVETTSGSCGGSNAGRIALRLRMSRSTCAWWLGLEARARRWLLAGMSWLRFLCLTMWHAWRHLLGAKVAYGRVYVRDRFRCISPVCSRRDVTPHHLHFRSAGGSDDDDNVGSVCTWCHLRGVHGGRIRATGTARLIHWELGAACSPCLVVHGRERMAARAAGAGV